MHIHLKPKASSNAAISTAISKEFSNLLADIEHLIKNKTALSGDDLAHAKAALSARIHAAKASIEEIGDAIADQARNTAESTDDYVHEYPWQAIGIGAGIGAALGLMVGVAITRR
jgi:ElaB/YqjD/DUF883 family membrane-anchored ribosome-binding protein